ncbi:HAD-IC family P-type ATPase [Arthrobacter sp. AL08]|uniref:HAD-IC family P-type ATPase n=1 Tax=unclassified Arthrobacter TaxID=235627 RepID=UPI002499F90D|nr:MULTISPECIES: HAD-IC family P-type ATPase [unclassified Arthrobacter]MDI3243490.1 HAD-IC family P-type ATPase [Arthrobacter sp. AL05]MDI3279498.1 HAD-IC family P-type ATPase [Arthrobacter sp. AL08]
MLHRRVSGPAASGLSRGDVASRMSSGLDNRLPDATSRSLWEIVRANVLTLFNAIVGTSFILLLLLGSWQDALFGLAAAGNAVIGVVQEYRAKRSLDRLAVLEAPLARVLRDGTVQEIPTADVVLDDVLVLRAGDQVTADASVLESGGLESDESLLTGESDPVDKDAGTEVLSGSIIVAGRGTARVVRVGAESFSSRLAADAKRFSLVNSEIRNSLNRILRWLTWALLPVALIVANGEMQSRGGWEAAIASGAWTSALVGVIASVIAMVPLGLVLLSSVAFAVGGVRMAGNKVLIQELAAVEGLARVDVLCLDKTGTLTEGSIIFDGVHELAGSAEPGWEHALGWFAADPEANATSRCLESDFEHNGGTPAVSSVPFSSARKWSSVTFDGGGTSPCSWILGAPEIVLADSSGGGSAAPSTEDALGKAGRLAASGLRTVVLAYADGTAMTAKDATLPARVKPVVVLTFREQIRADARQTLDYFRNEGVELKIISGDDPRTVAAIARSVGLDVGEGYDARQLPDHPALLEEVMEGNNVFGRVSPKQKKDMVAALQRRGHTVAMTGDGVNDVLALKEADLGIAMNSAAPATKAVARLVLLDGRFDRLPGVVAEGRRVIANVERVSKLFLSKTAYSIAIAVGFGLLNLQFPFLPRQLSFTDGLTIGIPSFFLALMANRRRYRPGFLRRSLSFSIPAGLVVAASLLGLNLYAGSLGAAGAAPESLQSASVLTLAVIGLWILAVVSRPLDARKLAVLLGMCAGLVLLLNVPLAQDFFHLALPPADMLWAAVIAAVGGGLAVELLAWIDGRRFPG